MIAPERPLDRTIDLRTGDMPSVLWIELTSKSDGEHMDFELYRSILAQLVRPSLLHLESFGRPGYHPRIAEAIQLAAATGAVTELVSDAATFPERDIETFVRSGLNRLTISLRALPAEQPIDRGLSAGEIAERFPQLTVGFSAPEAGGRDELDGVPRRFTGVLPPGARIHSCDQNPWDTVHVLVTGDVVTCEPREAIVLGNVSEQPLREIWRGNAYRAFRRDYVAGHAARCGECPLKIAYRPTETKDAIRLDGGMDPQLLRGWYPDEAGFVWSMGRSLATLAPRRAAGALRIQGILPPRGGASRNLLVVEAGSVPIGTIANDSSEMLQFETELRFAAPVTEETSFVFETASLYRPADHGSPDSRSLGFALRKLELVECPADEAPAAPRAKPFAGIPRAWRMMRLSATLRIARGVLALAERFPRRRRPPVTEWQPGLSIVVPERGNAELLADALAHAERAARATGEPFELIVVVNGSPLADYRELMERHPSARWLHSGEPLGFGEAIRRGTAEARYDGVYLLNNDMLLEEDALVSLLPWRAPNVFAIASQIFFVDRERRREETGWADFSIEGATVRTFEVEPEKDGLVRGTLYPSGGSSLFRRQYFERLQNGRDPYAPFYWEDAEWGIRAWREGYEVLFCPSSRAHHHHRSTIARFFGPADVDRIFARNGAQFLLRNVLREADVRAFLEMARDPNRCPDLTLRELTSIRNSLALVAAQWQRGRAPCADAPLRHVRRKFYPPPDGASAAKPVLLMASPYAVYPPAHGGAIRIAELLRTLAKSYRVVLLSDEESLYTTKSAAHFAGLHAVHLVGFRPRENPADVGRRIPRILNHTHAGFRAELRRLLVSYEPEIVQIEFVELAAAVEERHNGAAWFLTLHEALFASGATSEEDRFERKLVERYDAAIVCSAEDAALVSGARAEVVPNGTRLAAVPYVPSRGNAEILFAGPFRYVQNLEGIRLFLELVYPQLKQAVPHARLVVLGGDGAPAKARTMPCFDQPDVEVREYVADVVPLLERCAVTINPLYGIRGSSIKLIESLAAGRVCVSTRDGARGFLDGDNPALITVERVEDFAAPLERLLLDEPYRLQLERPAAEFRDRCSWDSSAQRLLEVYRRYHATHA